MRLPPLVEPVAHLDAHEAERTGRHAVLAGFGEVGQRRLAGAHVAIVGAGGLGAPAVLALAAAGVGQLTVIDDDTVELSNLQRQVMHRIADIGAPKVESAVRVAAELAPAVRVHAVCERLTGANASDLLAAADVVIDGTDTFETRTLVAAACEELGVPLVWGVVQEFAAQVTVFWSRPPEGVEPIVLADLYPPESVGELPSCAAVGVLGALVLQVGSVLSMEAIKLIAGIGEPLFGRVLVIDALRAKYDTLPLRPSRSVVGAETATASVASAARAVIEHITVADLEDALNDGSVILDVREDFEVAGGMIVGARHVPLAEVLADPAAIASVGERVVVVCHMGIRALRAAEALHANGINAVVLAGGMDAVGKALA